MSTADKNPGLMYLGVCPLLAKATTLLTGITMGVAALCILFMTVISVSSCRRYIPYRLRLPLILIISVTWVTVLDLLLQAYWFEMRQALEIYIPLLAMNSFILLSLEQTALTTSPMLALKATLDRGMRILLIVSLLGSLRELLGEGSLFNDANVLLGGNYGQWLLVDGAYTILHLAPGALLGLGLLLAAYKQIERRRSAQESSSV